MAAEYETAERALPDGRTEVRAYGYAPDGTRLRAVAAHFVRAKALAAALEMAAARELSPEPPLAP